MKKNLFVLLSIIIGVMSVRVHAAAEPARPAADQLAKRFLRLIVCVDDDGQEDIANPDESNAVTIDFAIAVHQASAPILVSSNLLRNFLIGQKTLEQAYVRNEFERALRAEYHFKSDSDRDFLKRWKYHYLYYNIPLTDDQWDVYQFGGQFLLIPHSYKEKVIQEADIAAINQMKLPTESAEDYALGFRLSSGEKKTIADLRARARELPKESRDMGSFAFHMMKTHPRDLLGTWNIYLVGHGIYAKDMQEGFVPTPDKPAHTWHDELGGRIAGISIADFRNTLKYLAEFVNMNMLVYSSCYAGDTNTILPYVKLFQAAGGHYVSPVQPNFIVVAGAITDTPTYAGPDALAHQVFGSAGATNLGWGTHKAYEREKNYTAFFESAESFFAQKKRVGAALSKSPLKDMLQHITPRIEVAKGDLLGIAATPLIRFPGVPFFRAVDVDNRLTVLTQALVTKHELENKPIEVNNKDAILFYTHAIRVPIKITDDRGIRTSPVFVSMIPGEARHYLKKVDVAATLKNFLFQASVSLESAVEKYIVIERLVVRQGVGGGGLYASVSNISKYYANVLLKFMGEKSLRVPEEEHKKGFFVYQKLSSLTAEPSGYTELVYYDDGRWERTEKDEELDDYRLFLKDVKEGAERESGTDISAPLGAFAQVRTEPLTEQEARARTQAIQRGAPTQQQMRERRMAVQKRRQEYGIVPTPGPKPGQKPVRPPKPEFLRRRQKPQRPEKPQWIREKAARRTGQPAARPKPPIPAKPEWVREKGRAALSPRKTLSERIKLMELTPDASRRDGEVEEWGYLPLD